VRAGRRAAANFVTIVPRDRAMLPPAIALDLDSRSCPAPPGEAAMQSELTTFLNQIEKHAELKAILMVSRSFEARCHLATMVNRNLWVRQDFFKPRLYRGGLGDGLLPRGCASMGSPGPVRSGCGEERRRA